MGAVQRRGALALALAHYVTGDWDEVLRLTEVAGQHAPPIPAALLESVRVMVLAGRGEPPPNEPGTAEVLATGGRRRDQLRARRAVEAAR